MAPLKFCANISWLFTELPDFSQRMFAAVSAGFTAVEAAWLYDSDLQELQRAREASGVELVLINSPPGERSEGVRGRAAAPWGRTGDLTAGDLGLAAVPGREAEFRKGLDVSVKYARALDCKRIHLMAGRFPEGADRTVAAKEMEAVFVQNLKYAADILSKEGMTGLIEPINSRISEPRYFLDSPHHAAAILEQVGRPNIQLQMIMDGNLTQNLRRYLPIIGHIQVAQVPGRNDPGSAGELNFSYLWDTLEQLGYHGYIGCEYKPLGLTEQSLTWIQQYWAQKNTMKT
ncbi:putative hydroxypyruvate isomerase isoform X2 [Gouania willdenowi]|uniref:putative hydroxypyruvate isomerase isoform X2 n=1 Tax=Gouania willdenowi TaxID=441366 RepID=UPI001055F356|nr:putative hydroxypyruvate isomerase isoform X2 [Gouania willdenowi]